LDRRLAEMNLDPKAYWWYRDLRRYGTVPHAGFGLGLERTIIYATGMANIRDVIPFPRAPGQAAFCTSEQDGTRPGQRAPVALAAEAVTAGAAARASASFRGAASW